MMVGFLRGKRNHVCPVRRLTSNLTSTPPPLVELSRWRVRSDLFYTRRIDIDARAVIDSPGSIGAHGILGKLILTLQDRVRSSRRYIKVGASHFVFSYDRPGQTGTASATLTNKRRETLGEADRENFILRIHVTWAYFSPYPPPPFANSSSARYYVSVATLLLFCKDVGDNV